MTTLDTTPAPGPQAGPARAVGYGRGFGAGNAPTGDRPDPRDDEPTGSTDSTSTTDRVPDQRVGHTEDTDVIITFDSDLLPCRVHDAELWFAERPADLEQAKTHCSTCPLRVECLDGALTRAEPWGVWGGEIFDHGVVIARKRPRGRPRKNDVAPVAA